MSLNQERRQTQVFTWALAITLALFFSGQRNPSLAQASSPAGAQASNQDTIDSRTKPDEEVRLRLQKQMQSLAEEIQSKARDIHASSQQILADTQTRIQSRMREFREHVAQVQRELDAALGRVRDPQQLGEQVAANLTQIEERLREKIRLLEDRLRHIELQVKEKVRLIEERTHRLEQEIGNRVRELEEKLEIRSKTP